MFEIVDTTSDEIYFTIAVYADYETALKELKERDTDDSEITESADYDGCEKIEIREHIQGWGKGHKTLLTLERTRKYDDDESFCWESEYVTKIPKHEPE